MSDLTIKDAQRFHPWNVLNKGYGAVPYSAGVHTAEVNGIPHIQVTHAVLHALKSIGKIAAVCEKLDHHQASFAQLDAAMKNAGTEVRDMAADLMTAALRFAHLFNFDLAEALVERAKEKNDGVGFESRE